MCHLSKWDTALAVHEMHRVLKRGGLGFLGVISTDSWPRSFFGEERAPGEYWMKEHGDVLTRHSMFSDPEAEALVSAWEVVSQEKRIRYLREAAEETSLERWMALYEETEDGCSREAWKARYERRAYAFRYAHQYFFLRKP
jgi:ubiquinone/menaquinone biosynthesis C-methylase UbiE